MVVGAMVTMLGFAGAYIGIRHRANEDPVDSYAPEQPSGDPQSRAAHINAK